MLKIIKYFGFIQPGSREFNLLLQLMAGLGWGGEDSVLKEKLTPSGRNVFPSSVATLWEWFSDLV